MKKRLLPLFTLLLAVCLTAKAKPVDVKTARQVGAKFLNANTTAKVATEQDLEWVTTYRTDNGTAAFYVFNAKEGFVIIAADDYATPILGYSTSDRFDESNLPPAMEAFLQGFVEEIDYCLKSGLPALDTVTHQWELVRVSGLLRGDRATTAVEPLMTSAWGQGANGYQYNIFCPDDPAGPNGHAITGCTATAMAQIMRYWGYPIQGTGSHGYTPIPHPDTQYPYQFVNFGNTTYDWANMPDELTPSSSQAENNAVATLMYHCGVSIEAKYGPEGTEANENIVADALKTFFKYSSDVHFAWRSDYSNDETWINKIIGNINKGWPVHYRGGGTENGESYGHMFVLDGYDANNAFHVNWGWYGNYQSTYFAFGSFAPVSPTHPYNDGNCGIFDIHPGECEDNSIHTLPFSDGFEAGDTQWECWQKYDYSNWTGAFKSSWTTYAYPTGGSCAVHHYNSSRDVNDWTIMPKIFLQPGRDNTQLTFQTWEGFPDDYTFEGVYISTSTIYEDDFTQVWTQDNPSASWKNVTINLNSYQGQAVYIAFVYTGKNGHDWYIDNVNVTESWQPCGSTSLPFEEHFDSNIGGCWYIIDSDMSGGERCWKWNESSQSAYHPYGQQDKPQVGWLISRRLFLQPGRDATTLTFRSGSTSDGTGKKNTIWLALDKPVGELTPSDFTVQVWEDPDYSSTWTTYTVDLSAYQGHTINIGFKYEGTYAHSWFIDDVAVTESWQPCGTTSLPFEDHFSSSIGGCWYIIDSDMSGGEKCWQWKESSQSAYHPHGQQDKPQVGWLISRRLFLQPGRDATTLTFKSGSTSDGTGKKNTIWLAIDKPIGELTPSDFTVQVWEDPAYSDTWTTYTVDLSAYQGHNINIGFKYEGTFAHNWFIDDVVVTESWQPCSYAMTPYNDSFDSSLSDCWYIIDSDKSGEERCWKYDASDNCAVHPWGQPDTPQVGWLFSKKVWLSSNYNYNLSFYAKTYSSGDGRRNSVWIAVDKTGTPNPSDYTEIWVDPSYNTGWTNYNIDLSEYAGHYVNIAFKYEGTFAHRWSIDDFSITKICNITASASPSAGGSVTGGGTYNEGTTCTLTATANTNYHFVNWTKNGTQVSTNSTYSFTVTGDGTYVANFALNSYSITASASPAAGGTVSGAGNYIHGQSCTLTATPNAGYTFVNWKKNGEVVSTNATYTFTVTTSEAYVASFSQNNYTITASADPTVGGTVSGGGNFTYGQSCTLTAAPNSSYTFVNWSLGSSVVSNEATYTFTVTESGNYVANFSQSSYSITASADPAAGGTVSGAGNYIHGQNCTLTATPYAGYTFVNWTLGGEVVSSNASYNFMVTASGAYVAHFSQDSYSITASPDPVAGGTVSGGGNFTYGQSCTLTATANTGYAFVNWTKGGSVVSTNASYTFSVTASGAYVAHFMLTSSNITQSTHFVNGWTWWSAYIEEDGGSCLTQLENGLGTSGQVIKNQSASLTHIGSNWYGGFSSIDNAQTYRVKTTAAVDVDITGPAVATASHPVTLKPNWTWIGYPCTSSMSVTTALAGITPTTGDILKSQTSSTVYLGTMWAGALNTLTPGMGLMYYSKKTSNMTLVYPTAKGDETKPNLTAENNHWQPNIAAYADNMTVLALVELDGAELQSESYELAVFANDECRGSVQLLYIEPLNRHMAVLTVAGEEAAELRFRLYNTLTGEEYLNASETLTYQTNAIVGSPDAPFVVRFRSNTGLDDFSSHIQLFPNPVGKGQTFNVGLADGEIGEAQVDVINALGVVVETRRATSLQAPNVPGVYTLRITVEGMGTCYRKLVVE